MTIDRIPFEEAIYPELTFARVPFPVAVLDGIPWWSTSHVQHFLGRSFRPRECDVFTARHVGAHRFPFDDDDLSHVISTMAALEIAGRQPDRKASKMVAGWLRKRDAELRTAFPNEAWTLFEVRAEGPKPDRTFYAGPIYDEWKHWDAEFRRRYGKPEATVPIQSHRVAEAVSVPRGAGRPPVPPSEPVALAAWRCSLIGQRDQHLQPG